MLTLLPIGAGQVQSAAGGLITAATITVPTGKVWEPTSMTLTIQDSATVGSRIIIMRFKNELGDAVIELLLVPTPAASEVCNFSLMPNAPVAAAFTTAGGGKYATHPLPAALLAPAWTITIEDLAAIDAAADTGRMTLAYNEYAQADR